MVVIWQNVKRSKSMNILSTLYKDRLCNYILIRFKYYIRVIITAHLEGSCVVNLKSSGTCKTPSEFKPSLIPFVLKGLFWERKEREKKKAEWFKHGFLVQRAAASALAPRVGVQEKARLRAVPLLAHFRCCYCCVAPPVC